MGARVLIRGGIVLPLEGRKMIHDPGSLGLALPRLLPPNAAIPEGRIVFDG